MKNTLATLVLVLSFSANADVFYNLEYLGKSHESEVHSIKKSRKEVIVNFSKVANGIYRGARLKDQAAVEYLSSIGTKSIINLQGGDLESRIGVIIPWVEPGERPENIAKEKESAKQFEIDYLHIPLNSLEPITVAEDKGIDQALEFMTNKENHPVFVHCEHGADRTGLLVALYRVKYEGVDIEVARSEWIKNGHNKLHQLFTGDLDDYYYEKVKEYKKN